MFEKIDTDKYKLKYVNKNKENIEIEFKRTNKMREMIEGINELAEDRLTDKIIKQGKSYDDYVIKKKDKNGHIIYDESTWNWKLKKEKEIVSNEVINEIFKMCFNKDMVELLDDMGINMFNPSDKEYNIIENLSSTFRKIITMTDNSPSN